MTKKGNMRFDIDVEGIERQIGELEKEVDKAVQQELADIASDSLKEAKNHIRKHDAVWNQNVLNNWIPIRQRTPFGVHVTGFQNFSEHAAAVDEGATYTDKKPPVDKLKIYIRSEYPMTAAKGEDAVERHAFALQEYIYDNGLRGINYTGAAERYAISVGPMRIKNRIEREAGD